MSFLPGHPAQRISVRTPLQSPQRYAIDSRICIAYAFIVVITAVDGIVALFSHFSLYNARHRDTRGAGPAEEFAR